MSKDTKKFLLVLAIALSAVAGIFVVLFATEGSTFEAGDCVKTEGSSSRSVELTKVDCDSEEAEAVVGCDGENPGSAEREVTYVAAGESVCVTFTE